jgi:hypothetical protein
MKTKTVSNRMSSLIVLYDMQTRYFSNAIEGISDKDSHNRLNTKANHIAWLTGSLVQQRFELANQLGIGDKQAANEFFKDNKGIQDGITYPPLASFKKDWEKISPVLRDALVNVSDEKLDTSFEMMPGMTMTNFDLIAFISYREANCIGQIALWRRLLGYDPMKYQ